MHTSARATGAVFAILMCVIATTGNADSATPEVTVVLDLPAPVQTDGAIVMDGAITWGRAGSPLLPIRTVRLVVPFGIDPDRLEVDVRPVEVENWMLKEAVAPAPVQQPIGLPTSSQATGPDPAIYETDAFFPAADHQIAGLAHLHGYPVLVLELFPVRINPVTGAARVTRSVKIRVRCPGAGLPTAAEAAQLRPQDSDRLAVASLVVNPHVLETLPGSERSMAVDWEYLVVTSTAMVSAFTPLATHRSSVDGMTTHIETISNILASYPGRDDAEKLRAFVIDGYQNHGTRYLVLGGDADVVPTRGCYGRAEVTTEDDAIPTDVYFGALDGDWNADGDSLWGEPEDGVDMLSEVAVGRIAAGNATEAQRQVAKIIAYETWSAAPFHTLLLGEQADSVTWGGDMLDYVYLQMAGSPHDTLYERDGSWSLSTLVNTYLNTGTMNVVNHMGHANESYVMKMGPSDASGLTNANPFFIYSQGCYAGAFDIADSMAEYFTVKGNAGCHAVIMNSRYGWYAPGSVFGTSTLFHREFLQAVYEEQITRLGDANNRSRSVLAGLAEDYGSVRWCAYDTTLFGDPATPLHWQCTATAARVAPESVHEGFNIMKSDPWVLSAAVHTNCGGALSGATVTVGFSTGEPAVLLHDDGVAPDLAAGDGHYSGLWTPAAVGPVTLSFTASAAGLGDGTAVVTGNVVPWMGYTLRASGTGWIDTTAGTSLPAGSILGNSDDGGWIVAIPFPFAFYGVTYADMMVDTNGLIQLEHGVTYSATEESYPIPYAGDDNGLIAPWWCDLELGSGSVRALVSGTSPNRSLTVEWHAVPHYSGVGGATFQVTLSETTNEIVFRYQDTAFGAVDYDHGADATVGIECPNGVHAVQYAYHETTLTDGLSIAFSPISPEGQALLDAASYSCAATAQAQVLDADLDGQTEIIVTVESDTETTPLQVTLTPAGDPRIFAGTFAIAEGTPVPDSVLQVAPGDTVTLRYQDSSPAGERTATALIDCVGPVISGLEVVNVGTTSAVVQWSTDEPSSSWVEATPGGATASDTELDTAHSVLLTGLDTCSSYTVEVSSTDSPGNSSIGGPSSPFTTFDLTVAVDDDVEDGNQGWTVDTAVDPGTGTNWSIVSDGGASSPTHSWFSSDENDVKDDRLELGPITLGSGSPELSFAHHYSFEGYGSTAYDGGVLEVSTDGSSWQDVEDAGGIFIEGGYDGSLSTGWGNPLEGRSAWTNGSPGLLQTRVDLSSLAGGDLWLRFRLGCDSMSGADGWWIDDIRVETAGECANLSVFADGFEDGTTDQWSFVSP